MLFYETEHGDFNIIILFIANLEISAHIILKNEIYTNSEMPERTKSKCFL